MTSFITAYQYLLPSAHPSPFAEMPGYHHPTIVDRDPDGFSRKQVSPEAGARRFAASGLRIGRHCVETTAIVKGKPVCGPTVVAVETDSLDDGPELPLLL